MNIRGSAHRPLQNTLPFIIVLLFCIVSGCRKPAPAAVTVTFLDQEWSQPDELSRTERESREFTRETGIAIQPPPVPETLFSSLDPARQLDLLRDRVVVPAGTLVEGHVVSAQHSGRLHHPGKLGLTLDNLIVDQHSIPLVTSEVAARGKSYNKRNRGWIGGGALIGALAAGGKGALIGSGIGAAAGTTTAFITGKKDIAFGNERRLRFRLNHDVSMFG